jgi:protein-S-isoprenylcysteine O-methyltransferase Ste14
VALIVVSFEMMTSIEQPRQSEPIDRRRLLLNLGLSPLRTLLCLFLPAGTWAWFRGWLFLFVFVVASIVGTLYLRRVNPEVIAARINRREGTRRRDRNLGVIFLTTVTAIPILAALGDGRFHWSPVPWWGCLLGYTFLIAELAGMTWAQAVNKFFEASVRIQTERGHTVIDTGPYAVVRHPGYAAGYLLFVGMPLALGSLWALVPVILLCPLLLLRTVWEDRMLREGLAGNQEYAQRVRYRLVPGVW